MEISLRHQNPFKELIGLCEAVTSMPAEAPNSVTAQYISSVPAMPRSKTFEPASQTPRATNAARHGRSKLGRGLTRVTPNDDGTCPKVLTHGAANAVGNGRVKVHAQLASHVVSFKAGQWTRLLNFSHQNS